MSLLGWRRHQGDAIDEQLRDIASQGAGMARVAHLFAFGLIALFSVASLVALGGDALVAVVSEWRSGGYFDIPKIGSLVVVVLLVPAFDAAMLYAAARIRLLFSRRARRRDYTIHWGILLSTAMVEAGAYAYMAWRYEGAPTLAAWALIVIRAVFAPLLAIYLSMARALPVTAKDIMAQVELASGSGLLRDAVGVANDPNAPMSTKAAIFAASQDSLPSLMRVLNAGSALPALTAPGATVTILPEDNGNDDGPGGGVSTSRASSPLPFPVPQRAPASTPRRAAPARNNATAQANLRAAYSQLRSGRLDVAPPPMTRKVVGI